MKKTIISVVMYSLIMNLFAQTEVTTQTFDLESIDRHKGWFFYDGYKNQKGETILKIGKGNCDSDKTKSGNLTTGTTITTTYNGIAWDFEELIFDADFTYKSKIEKTFPNTVSAMEYAPIWGKGFIPTQGDGRTHFASAVPSTFMGNRTIVPLTTFSKFKIGEMEFYGQATGGYGKGLKQDVEYCGEQPAITLVKSIEPKEEPGQKWNPIQGIPLLNAGIILYKTDGVYPEENTFHYVLKKYSLGFEELGKIHIPFNYSNAIRVTPIEKENGMKDLLIISEATDIVVKGYNTKAMNTKPAGYVEIVYVDGTTFEIKYRISTNLPYSQWNANGAFLNSKGELYITGAAGKDNKTFIPCIASTAVSDWKIPTSWVLHNNPKLLPNFQVVKIKDNKLEYVTATSKDDAQSVVNVLSGIKEKGSATPIFTMPASISKLYEKNGKLIIVGQQLLSSKLTNDLIPKKEDDKGHMVTIILDAKNGEMLSYLIKPESSYGLSDEFFSADGKKMYWACYEYASLNTVEGEVGTMTSKKVPSMLVANLHFVTIDLTANTVSPISWIGEDSFAISHKKPVLIDSDNEIVFLGRTLDKKAKDSELVLVKVKK